MRVKLSLIIGMSCLVPASGALAAEGGFSVYGLGGSAFNAGITPPAGTYATPYFGLYTGVLEANTTIGGVPISAGADIDFLQGGLNLLYAPDNTILEGQPAFSLAVPMAYVDIAGTVNIGGVSLGREESTTALGDITPRFQLGWHDGTFFQTAYLQATLPTGFYEPGFHAITGLNRPAIDGGWGFTWIEPNSKIQLNAMGGITYNFENTATHYQTGTEFHLDWAVGKDFGNGLILGVVGYNYRQITGDSGTGATLGDFMGSVDAVGLGLNYSAEWGETPVNLALRSYKEFNVTNRFEGSTMVATLTFAF